MGREPKRQFLCVLLCLYLSHIYLNHVVELLSHLADNLLFFWLAFTWIVCAALCGNYVNFGVFELYGDRALADALDISLKMTLSIPLSDILTFKKVLSYSCHLWNLVTIVFLFYVMFVSYLKKWRSEVVVSCHIERVYATVRSSETGPKLWYQCGWVNLLLIK